MGLYDDSFTAVAEYEYSPFGELIGQNGPYAEENPYRFSTKYQNEHLGGLYYYGYRYYDASAGRWPSRDPIGEEGGVNLYAFVGNDGVNYLDVLGLDSCDCGKVRIRDVSGMFGGGGRWNNGEWKTLEDNDWQPPQGAGSIPRDGLVSFELEVIDSDCYEFKLTVKNDYQPDDHGRRNLPPNTGYRRNFPVGWGRVYRVGGPDYHTGGDSPFLPTSYDTPDGLDASASPVRGRSRPFRVVVEIVGFSKGNHTTRGKLAA